MDYGNEMEESNGGDGFEARFGGRAPVFLRVVVLLRSGLVLISFMQGLGKVD